MEINKRSKDQQCYVGFSTSCIFGFFLLLFLFSANILAGPVKKQQAEKMVRGWLKADTRPLGVLLGRQIKNTDTFYNEAGEPIYYVIYLQPSGFIIAPADDKVEPIICIAAGQTYSSSDDNPLGALVSQDVPSRIAAVRSLDIAASGSKGGTSGPRTCLRQEDAGARRTIADRAHGKWNQLSSYDDTGDASGGTLGASGISEVWVSPLVQSTWGQTTVGGYDCYNYYTPNNWPCGCVATAMAQLMRYHEYPGDYVWSNMPLQPDESITLTERQAIGALCYDASESVDTIYGSGGSSASLSDASEQLESTFYYSNSIYGYNPSIGTALNNMMNPNLDAELPVLLGLDGPYGGHIVVCDGYGYNGSTLYHHLNLGWDGREDAWYNLPDVDSSPYYFNSVNGCAYNIFTSNTGEIISGRVTDMADNPIPDAIVTATGGGTYYATTNNAGIYALVGVPWNQSFIVSASRPPYTFVNRNVSTGKSNDWSGTSGNKWGINFASQSAGPPIAYGQSVTALSGITETITLNASDDGLPNPPGQLSYIIATLPEHGTLTDPAAGEITNVPYTLAGDGNIVDYWPCSYFIGQDSFDFKANDGGTPPQGGDSEAATVTIDVNNVINTTFEPQTDLYASWPMRTSYHDSRTQVIYLAGEIGDAQIITDLALDVYHLPGQTLNNWTIRMKHTSKSYYSGSVFFETTGWTIVYQNNEAISSTGWQNFHFQNAFEYNGTDNLMIDLSHNNSFNSTNGYCMVSNMGNNRVLIAGSDSGYGDPLYWSESYHPPQSLSAGVPNIKLISNVPSAGPIDGDFEPDCKVGMSDLGILAAAWLSSSGDGNWNPACDIYQPSDNIINFKDFCILAEHWLEIVP